MRIPTAGIAAGQSCGNEGPRAATTQASSGKGQRHPITIPTEVLWSHLNTLPGCSCVLAPDKNTLHKHSRCYGACAGSPMAASLPAARSGGYGGLSGLEMTLGPCCLPRVTCSSHGSHGSVEGHAGSRTPHSPSSCCSCLGSSVTLCPRTHPQASGLHSSIRVSLLGISPKTLWWLCNLSVCFVNIQQFHCCLSPAGSQRDFLLRLWR